MVDNIFLFLPRYEVLWTDTTASSCQDVARSSARITPLKKMNRGGILYASLAILSKTCIIHDFYLLSPRDFRGKNISQTMAQRPFDIGPGRLCRMVHVIRHEWQTATLNSDASAIL